MNNKCRSNGSSIRAGQLLLTEEPFVYVLSSKEKGLRCDNCLEKCKVLKCSGCQFVHYCGRACQRDAWNDHKWECNNLKRIAPKVIPDAARMLARVINKLTRGDGASARAFYTHNSFRMWKDLMSHYSDLKADSLRMEHFAVLCGVLNDYLRDISLPNAVEMMGIYGRMVINSFTILDIDMNSIGTGVYLACSVVDHSCSPNAVATFDGKTISIRATQDMPCLDWDQIRISYIDLMKTPYERQKELLKNYYFLCQCHRCLDETQHKLVYAAKCLNSECDNPVVVPWDDKRPIVMKEAVKNNEQTDSQSDNSNNSSENKQNSNGSKENGIVIEQDLQNGGVKQNDGNIQNGYHEVDDVIHCTECGTKYTEQKAEEFRKTMYFTESHLQDMKDASVAYVDVCKFCLERQSGVLHRLSVSRAQTLDHAVDALVQVQLWAQACRYVEELLPCFKYYYGDRHPLLGLLHLKYGKILLYKMEVMQALEQFKCSEKILKITHGDRHPLYKEELMPLLRQAISESSQS